MQIEAGRKPLQSATFFPQNKPSNHRTTQTSRQFDDQVKYRLRIFFGVTDQG